MGTLSVSRPVYAVLPTGLEQDRTGVRNNDDTSPCAAESLWQVARRTGLTVTATKPRPKSLPPTEPTASELALAKRLVDRNAN